MRKLILALSTVLLASISLCAQKTTFPESMLAGMNSSIGVYPEWTKPLSGIVLEKRLKGRSGVETGLFYRRNPIEGFVTYTDATGTRQYDYTIARSYLSLPLLYRYYTRSVTLSAGPVLDFFLGSKQKEDLPFAINYVERPGLRVGFLLKAGRVVPLGDHFILEPEVRFGSIQTFDEASLGVGLSGKYRF